MVNVWRKLIGLKSDYSFVNRIIDTRCLAMAIAKQIPVQHDNFMSWQYKLLNHRDKTVKASQLALLKQYGIEFDASKLHDALYDVEMTYKIFKKQIYDIEV